MGQGVFHPSRRLFLGGLAASVGNVAFAGAPETSIWPAPRPVDWTKQTLPSIDDLIARSGFAGKTGIALADARTGQIIEAHSPLLAQPPASVTKSITALYALDALGPGFRFRTRLIATGPILNGRLDGDLILAGGGDPTLETNALADMASQLKATGLREITGRLRVAEGALPQLPLIDPSQPDHVGYNPSISGLNLNFNRVYFEWKQATEDAYDVAMDARSDRYRPRVTVADMRIEDRDLPVFTYANSGGRDRWTVARSALGQEGGRWLPVRHPGAYTAEVFQTLAGAHGIQLRLGDQVPGSSIAGSILVEHTSEDLREVLRQMLRWSTNITAEAAGLSATGARNLNNTSLERSGKAMADWLEATYGANRPSFVDHSGLGDASRLTPRDMVHALTNAGAESLLRGILKDIYLRDRDGETMRDSATKIVAKTGTLNFVSTLAGYIRTANGRDLAFAIFSSDIPHRNRLTRSERERPDGGRAWSRRARALQNDLLLRWSIAHDV